MGCPSPRVTLLLPGAAGGPAGTGPEVTQALPPARAALKELTCPRVFSSQLAAR